jgi:uncharacterized membrane protein
MESFLLFVVIVIVVIRWWVLRERYGELERRIESAAWGRVDPEHIAALVKRVYQLETAVAELKFAPAAPEFKPQREPQPEPVTQPVPMEAEPEPIPRVIEAAEVVEPDAVAEPPAPIEPAEAPTPLVTIPSALADLALPPTPARATRNSAEWEALVGGNWLNKLGIFVLVIAIALFLGYSFTQLGPAGRSAIGLVVSATLMAGGVLFERRAPYVIFARGLIAGGWAGLYFTIYAMQAVEAAKVIDNPWLGSVLLLAVASGMVLHSLRYRAQALTGLAYAVTFATLTPITPITALSVIALVPLAASLLIVAYRFEWPGMALFGLIATYATCASRGDSGAPLWQAQSVFAAYWLVFETYDLLRARRRSNLLAEQSILTLNAIGFGLLSYAKWIAAVPADLYKLSLGVAAAYLISMILRALLRPPSSFPGETGTLERILAGGFEGPITLAAACSVVAAVLKLHGQTANNVLLAEGELLFIAGLVFRQDYPRRLAAALFAALGVKLIITDIPDAGAVQFAGRMFKDWTPSAALAVAVFHANRWLRKSGKAYGYAASALIALIMGFEIPLRHLGAGWLGLGVLLFVVGWRFRLPDFRLQGYMAGAIALQATALYQAQIAWGISTPWPYAWVSLALAAAVSYAAASCARRSPVDRLTDTERGALEFVAGAAASVASVALLWRIVPDAYLGPAWMALALGLLELGLRHCPPDLRWHAYLVAVLGAGRVLLLTVLPLHPILLTSERVAIGSAALLAYAFAARMFLALPEQVDTRECRRALNAASACGSFFVLVALWALLDPIVVAPVWALFALLLLAAGWRARLPGVRLESHAVAAAVLVRLFAINFTDAGYSFGISHCLTTIAFVVACYGATAWWHRRVHARLAAWEAPLYRPYLYAASALVATLIDRQLRPQWIALGWAAFALLLLVLGRRLNLRDFQYQSYALAALAFVRCLAAEFQPPVLSILPLERILVASLIAACLFLAQLLIPFGRERAARLFYSLLSTAIVTTLLYQEVSGSVLTVAWGIEGAGLLICGFPLRDRTLRLSGLMLFLVCVGKLFFYDLRQLETLYRILSFFVLGVILVGVSWLYTRFRGQIQRYL